MLETTAQPPHCCVHSPDGCSGPLQLNWLEFDTRRYLRCQAHSQLPGPRTGDAPADPTD